MLFINIVLYIYIFLFNGARAQKCNGGAQCVSLQSCTNLYLQVQEGRQEYLKRLLRRLHCGFYDDAHPMICCPPEFNDLPVPANESSLDDGSLLLPNSTVCGVQNSDRIIGGTETELDEHPWAALLRYDKPHDSGFHCGGVLITSRYVLTAGHCVKNEELPASWKLTHVRLGEWNTASDRDCSQGDCSPRPLDIPVEQVIIHEDYSLEDSNRYNDIALLRMKSNVQFNDFVKPICLPISDTLKRSPFEGYEMEVVGWGRTETGFNSDVKLKLRVPIVSQSQCNKVYNQLKRTIANKQICAGGQQGRDSCAGDSGGALMARVPPLDNWHAIGIVSYGPSPCGTLGWPGVYTRVGAYVDWIISKLRP